MRKLYSASISRPLLTLRISAFLIVMWAVFAGIAVETYRAQWTNAELFAADVTSLIRQDITRNVDFYDQSLKSLDAGLADPSIGRLPAAIRRRLLFDRFMDATALGSLSALDRNGAVIADSAGRAPSGMNLADRDYFLAQRDGTAATQPFVSHPFVGRSTSKVSIAFSRPRTSPEGGFDGVVVSTMTLDYVGRLFEAVHLPADSSITLIHSDGTILMRAPVSEAVAGRSLRNAAFFKIMERVPEGTLRLPSPIDGVERLFAYRQVGALPVYLAVGFSVDRILRTWRWQVAVIGGGFVLLSVIVLMLGAALVRELDRRAAAERDLAELAATDSLTLLANRRRFDIVLEAEWHRAVRDGTELSLLMLDGDYFKAFNDTYGHVEGDVALRAIADVLRARTARPGDLAARFGGEEFVVLLPSSDQDGAARIGLAIRRAVGALAVPHAGSPFRVLTVSVGAATCRPSEGVASSSLVEAADAALYVAKGEGRNRVVSAERPARHTPMTEAARQAA